MLQLIGERSLPPGKAEHTLQGEADPQHGDAEDQQQEAAGKLGTAQRTPERANVPGEGAGSQELT